MPEAATLFYSFVLLLVAFVVIYPIVLLSYQSFQVGQFGTPTVWGLENWRAALTEPAMREAIVNTLTLTVARQVMSFSFGVVIAWLLARTDIPGRYWLEFGFWVAFFLPSLTSTLGWILLLDPDYGLINRLLLKLPFVEFTSLQHFLLVGDRLRASSDGRDRDQRHVVDAGVSQYERDARRSLARLGRQHAGHRVARGAACHGTYHSRRISDRHHSLDGGVRD